MSHSIHKKRIPRGEDAVRRYFQGAPDLVVEVLSPWDRTIRTHDKMVEYFDSGARLAWVVNAEEKSALVYHGAEAERLVRISDALAARRTWKKPGALRCKRSVEQNCVPELFCQAGIRLAELGELQFTGQFQHLDEAFGEQGHVLAAERAIVS